MLKGKLKLTMAVAMSAMFLLAPISVKAESNNLNNFGAPAGFDWEAERARERAIFDKFEAKYKKESNKRLLGSTFNECVGGEALVTKDSSSCPDIPFIGHAGIVWDGMTSIEAQPKEGVCFRSSNTWLDKRKTVYILKCPEKYDHTQPVRDWAETQIGKPYNWNYFDRKTTDSFYCSQLVWRSYLDSLNINLCPGAVSYVSPADILNSSKLDVYWAKY